MTVLKSGGLVASNYGISELLDQLLQLCMHISFLQLQQLRETNVPANIEVDLCVPQSPSLDDETPRTCWSY